MSTPNDDLVNLRVKGPALPVVRFPSAEGALPSELIRVKGPALPVVKLTSERAMPTATVRLTLPLATGADGEKLFQTLRSLVEKVNEMESLFGRAGVWVDGTRSRVRNGEVVIVLAPNDSADAVETCKRVANILFNASQGVTVRVFVADEPETPVYELAA